MARNHLNMKERVAVLDALTKALTKIPPDMCRYDGDMTDQKIAEQLTADLGRTVTVGNVAGMRIEMFGKLNKPAANSIEARLVDLERRVKALEDAQPREGQLPLVAG